MAIEFRCMMCSQRLRVADEHLGQRARCPNCEAVLDIPADDSTEPLVLTADKADVIDYEMFGDTSQHVEITLDPGEVVLALPNAMLYMSPGICKKGVDKEMDHSDASLIEMITKASRRMMVGDAPAMHAFCNIGNKRECVAFAPLEPSQLLPLHMDELGGRIICDGASILCIARGIQFDNVTDPPAVQRLNFQQLLGNGLAMLSCRGNVVHRTLSEKKRLHVDAARVVAFTSSVNVGVPVTSEYDEELSVLTVTGPGEIWMRTLV